MDWNRLTPDKTELIDTHYTSGRSGQKVDKIVIHHNAGVRQSTHDVATTWRTRPASAHFQVEHDGTIGQCVRLTDTAWHAGNWTANCTSIGIEHTNTAGPDQWPVSDATIDAGAHLVAALCARYGLGAPTWKVNVFPHQYFQSTACPARLADTSRPAYMAKALAYYNEITGHTAPQTKAAEPATGRTRTDHQDLLTIDGIQGTRTQARFEQVMGVTINGVDETHEPAFQALQKWLNTVVSAKDIRTLTGHDALAVDGIAGTATWKVFQYWVWNRRPDLVEAFAPSAKRMPQWVDGVGGRATWKAMQTILNESWAGSGKLLGR